MQYILNYSLQIIFYVFGFFGLLVSLKCFLDSSKYTSIFFISFIVSFIIGYFFKVLFNKNKILKEKNLVITIFSSWLLLTLVSAIPFLSFIDVLAISDIFFISTSFITTTGFQHKFLDSLNVSEAFNIWCSIIQLIGGVFSIVSYILFFLVFFNKHDKHIVFNKNIILKFFSYYFFLFLGFFIFLNLFLEDIYFSFMISSAIISTGGQIGSFGPVLGYYYSNNLYLIIYLFLSITTILILPLFLIIQNYKVLESSYIKLLNRSLILLLVVLLILCLLFEISALNFIERFFIYFSFLTTSGILPNKTSDILVIQQLSPLFFIFLILIIIGSLSGSSGGGLKIDKISILFIKIRSELRKLTLSHKLYGAELIKKGYNQKELNSLFALLALGGIFVAVTLLILTSSGHSVFESFVLTMASLTNTGEGFLHVNNMSLNKSFFSYLILNFLMIFGRFEVIGYLLIFQKFTIKNSL